MFKKLFMLMLLVCLTLGMVGFTGCKSSDGSSDPPPPIPIVAEFSGAPLSGIVSLEVSFSDSSTGEIDSWLWNFGDGNTSTLQNPIYIYNQPNQYTVTLTVTGPNGSDTLEKVDYITVDPPLIEAYFVGAPLSGTAPFEVTFNETSTGNIDSWLWDFGDGNTSTEQNPVYVYEANNIQNKYTVTLTVSDSYTSNIMERVEYVDVSGCIYKVTFIANGRNPSFDNGKGLFTCWDNTSRWGVCYYDGQISSLLTNFTESYVNPKYHNGKGVWDRSDGHDREIFFWDGVNIQQVTNNNVLDIHPDIYNDTYAWVQGPVDMIDTNKIMYFDGNITRIIAEYPQTNDIRTLILYDGEIVWEWSRSIYKWSETTGIVLIHDDNGYEWSADSPSFDGNQISFSMSSGSHNKLFYGREIYLFNGVNKIRITDNALEDNHSVINNGEIAWWRDMDISGSNDVKEIFWWDGFSEIRVTNNNIGEYNLCWDKITGDLYLESNGNIYKIEMGVVP